jgi:hypothetical protein
MKFTVKWEVEFYDHDKKLYCDIDEDDDNINNLDDIHEFLEEGVDENKFSPEDQVEYHDGDFNIEYVLIYNEKGEILWKDQDYEG